MSPWTTQRQNIMIALEARLTYTLHFRQIEIVFFKIQSKSSIKVTSRDLFVVLWPAVLSLSLSLLSFQGLPTSRQGISRSRSASEDLNLFAVVIRRITMIWHKAFHIEHQHLFHRPFKMTNIICARKHSIHTDWFELYYEEPTNIFNITAHHTYRVTHFIHNVNVQHRMFVAKTKTRA